MSPTGRPQVCPRLVQEEEEEEPHLQQDHQDSYFHRGN